VVPRVERGEFVNAGVIVSCAEQGLLQAAIELDESRLLALDPNADFVGIRAALYFHHDWRDVMARANAPFALIKDHVLLPFATELAAADAWMTRHITPARIAEVVAQIPDTWLEDETSFASKAAHRDAYTQFLTERLAAPRAFFEEARRAQAVHV
jgi:hypothetical protein